MKLEEEIKQNSFNNEIQKLAVNIIYTHSWLISHQSKVFDKYNITTQQYNILRILRGQYPKPTTVSLLKARMLDKMSDASRLVERLRSKDLVARNHCKEDRRRAEVIITEKGLKLLEELDSIDESIKSLFSNISDEEAKAVNAIFDKLRG